MSQSRACTTEYGGEPKSARRLPGVRVRFSCGSRTSRRAAGRLRAPPAGGSPSSAARAASPLRRAQPVERDTRLPCREACDGDARCGATGIIRGAAKTLGNTTEDVFERRQVDEDAGHATAGPIPQAPCTSGLDRTRRRAHRARPTPPRAPYADAAYVAGGRRGRHWYDRAAAAPIKLRRGVP